jgi:hypothetical protein
MLTGRHESPLLTAVDLLDAFRAGESLPVTQEHHAADFAHLSA